ncbi:MAG: metallophosphoesterase family protein [Chloroflexi bacterium]|nr:metallophosphoesterase family protein [Chloroflexota bacterium]
MRIALLSDIHGNLIALEAVLADIEAQDGVDAFWVLGDLVAIGLQPVAVLERIHQLPNVRAVRGNTDRYAMTLDRPGPTAAEVMAAPNLLPVFAEVAHTFAWTQGCLAATGWLDYLRALPIEQRLALPDGTRLLGVHGSPGLDDGRGLTPRQSDEKLLVLLDQCNADLICAGHTHWPMNRRVGDYHVINLGSVSNPLTPDMQASYVLLHADSSGYTIEHRRVAYDHAAVIAVVEAVGHPAGNYIIDMMRGKKVRHHWGEPDV